MYRRILVPLDGSELARQIVPYATLVAGTFAIPVVLLEVLPKVTSEAGYLASQEAFLAMLIARRRGPVEPGAAGVTENPAVEAERRLDEIARPLRDMGLPVETDVAVGDAATEIIEAASKGNAGTLIVMSTHGRTALTRWLLGSVTDKVVRNGRHPVLVVRPQTDQPDAAPSIREVVLPLDGSALSEEAVPHAVEMALKLNIPIAVLRSTSPMAYGGLALDTYSNAWSYSDLLEEIGQDVD